MSGAGDVTEYFNYYLEEQGSGRVARKIVGKALLAARCARKAARAARDNIIRKGRARRCDRMPGKLADC